MGIKASYECFPSKASRVQALPKKGAESKSNRSGQTKQTYAHDTDSLGSHRASLAHTVKQCFVAEHP